MKNHVVVALLGFGTVGSALYRLIESNASLFKNKCSKKIEFRYILVQDIEKKRPQAIKSKIVNDFDAIISDEEVDIIIELIGGINDAYRYCQKALKAGKHVVTANKALIAEHAKELHALARKYNVCLQYEASVAGAIPIIKSLHEGLAANHIKSIHGILNGTCNFILSQMEKNKADFQTVLNEAQRLGYAEADPSFDIEGLDTAHKLSILAMLAFNIDSPYQRLKLNTEGISHITQDDILFSEDFGYKIKLLGIAKHTKNSLFLRVQPCLIEKKRMLAAVQDAFNAIRIEGDFSGPSLFYGLGAGGDATASAVAGDIIQLIQSHNQLENNQSSHINKSITLNNKIKIIFFREENISFYLRFKVKDQPGVLSKITSLLAKAKVNICAIEQNPYHKNLVNFVILTDASPEKAVRKVYTNCLNLDVVKSGIMLPIETEI